MRELAAARQLSPHDPYMWLFEMQTANAYVVMGQFEDAEQFARSAIRRPGAGFWAYAVLASALGNLGRIEEARPVCKELLELKPDFSRKFVEDLFVNVDQSFLAPYFEGLYKAGLHDPDQAASD